MSKKTVTDIPTVLVIFGATGDLMAKKVLPALFHLFEKNRLPKLFRTVGIGRRYSANEEFKDHVARALERHEDIEGRNFEPFLSFFSYFKASVVDPGDYERLKRMLSQIDREWHTCSNKLFYFGIPPRLYETVLENLARSGLTKPCSPEEGWTRLIIEKPFGNDLESAKRICRILYRLFREEQLFLIDHYLGKEIVQNIPVFRLSNSFLESFWNNKYVKRIEVRLLESIGVEGRGRFYDPIGALRDVGQSHLLQMLALATMDNPDKFDSSSIRRKRAEILQKLRTLSENNIVDFTFRAQYKGYKNVQGVRSDSTTETYFKLLASLDTSRWQGVPIILESGKRLGKPRKEIVMFMRHPRPCLCPPESKEHQESKIAFTLEPREAIEMHFQSKEPGFRVSAAEKPFSCIFRGERRRIPYVEEYEKLLFDCIAGDQTFFVSIEEIEASWRFIDPIVDGWKEGLTPLAEYDPDKDEILSESKVLEQNLSQKSEIRREIGIVGLGKMGSNLALNLLDHGWRVFGYNRTYEKTKRLESQGIVGTKSLEELAAKLEPPRIVWLMVEAGKPVDELLFGDAGLIHYLGGGDIVIDGGNSFCKDSIGRAERLEKKGIFLVDVGVSGGPEGARYGACLMVGGKRRIYDRLLPLFFDVSAPQGVQFFEGAGAGHFVKMVHNGIEYGIMQAIAEGFTILKNAKYALDLKDVADIYNHGSVIESRLISWLKEAFEVHGVDLENISGTVGHTGEGEWAAKTARQMGIKAKIIEESVKFRIRTEKNPSYTGKILSALREQFGGHAVVIRKEKTDHKREIRQNQNAGE